MSTAVAPNGVTTPSPPNSKWNNSRPKTLESRPNSTPPPKPFKKNSLAFLPNDDPDFATLPASHGFPCGVIRLFLLLVQTGIPLRAASRALAILVAILDLPFHAPHWTTGRLWVLRFGLACLQAPKERSDDWAWLIDHSVQIGQQKILVILAIRLADLPPRGQALCHDQMELIALEPMISSTRQDVADRLEQAAQRTCVPRVIVDDCGVDLTGGVEIFRRDHPQTVEIHDIKHKAACLLKARLERDPRWQSFASWVGRVRCAIQQTELAALVPPGPRPKARFMNLGPQLVWAEKILALIDHPEAKSPTMTTARLEEKLGEIRNYRGDLAQWRQWQDVVDEAVGFVACHGLESGTAGELLAKLKPECQAGVTRRLAEELVEFVETQASQTRVGERLPGSTEVLESSFGKFKALEKGQSRGGFTSLLLGFGALLKGAASETVRRAMETTPTKAVKEWCSEHLGQTLHSERKIVFAAVAAQQKSEEHGP
jgi:hypothetical protein